MMKMVQKPQENKGIDYKQSKIWSSLAFNGVPANEMHEHRSRDNASWISRSQALLINIKYVSFSDNDVTD